MLKIVNDQYQRAKQLLTEHKEGHAALAQLLFDKEVIYREDVEKILGKRQWTSRSEVLMKENERIEAERKAKEDAEAPKLEDMPDEVKQAQAEHDKAVAEQVKGENTGKNPECQNTENNKEQQES